MIPQDLTEVAGTVSGEVVDVGTDNPRVEAAAFVDSRAPVAGGLFVAVAGEHVDGHDFAPAAVQAGAAAALVQRSVGVPAVLVDDTVAALGELARSLLRQLPELTVIGITGSQGKTGTKDIVAALLERSGPTVAPTGSFNTEIGLPLTVTRVDTATRYLVAELGARGRGHIRYLTTIAPPRIGVVLNVGMAHIGEFGSKEAIAAAKGELVEALPPRQGVAVLNRDDPLVYAMRDRTEAEVVTFGRTGTSDVQISHVNLDDCGRARFDLSTGARSAHVRLQLVGEHQAANAAAAAAVALTFGQPLDEIADTLSAVQPRSRWRMEVATSPAGVTVVNDAYNANPDSMRAALQTLVTIARRRRPPARTIAVLGEMLELGDVAVPEHVGVGQLVAALGVDVLVAVGPAGADIGSGARSECSWSGRIVSVEDPEEAADVVAGLVCPGDVVLVKASRATGLESVAAALLGAHGGAK